MEGNKPITRKTGPAGGSSNRFHLPRSGHTPPSTSSPLLPTPKICNPPIPLAGGPLSNFPQRQSSSLRQGQRATPRHLLRKQSGSLDLDSARRPDHLRTDAAPVSVAGTDRLSTPKPAAGAVPKTTTTWPRPRDERKSEHPQIPQVGSRDGHEPGRGSSWTIQPGPTTTSHSHSFSSTTDSTSWTTPAKRRPPSRPPPALGFTLTAAELKHVAMGPYLNNHKTFSVTRQMNSNSSFSRSESLSSASVNTAQSGVSARTVTSSNPSASGETASNPRRKAFIQRNGRTYLNDTTLAYPAPVDLAELHRQTLRTLLLIQAHGGPVRSPALLKKPPKRVLEVGCSTGFWSMMCHRFFKSRGHSGISFTGIDIAPVAPGSANIPLESMKPDKDMNWNFVEHDLRDTPWPFEDGQFDLVFSKDMALAIPLQDHPNFSAEILRVLGSGGVFEIWETDYTIRMLRPHVPNTGLNGVDVENQEAASSVGSYMVHLNTPLSAPLNTFLVEYNNWVSKVFESRGLWPTPGTMMSAYILAEIDILMGMGVHRVAVPFSEVRWEREGVGGVVTKDGKSYVEMRGDRPPHQKVEKKTLTSGQAALRRTALLTFVEEIQALEPYLREVSGKSQDEWDVWMGKMMVDLMNDGGTSWGECLEAGAWWATKR